MNRSNKVRSQNKLIELAQAGRFFAVTYDKNTKKANDVDDTTDPVIAPASVLANEIQQNFSIDPLMGRKRILQRDSWVFQLLCTWDQEVTVEFFEKDLLDPLPRLPDDKANELEDVTLILNRTEVLHPPTQQAANGTAAKFTFEAVIGRK